MKKFCLAVVILVLSNFNANADNWNGSGVPTVVGTELRLDCETTNYGLADYPKEWASSWVPEKHVVIISKGEIRSLTKGARGKVVKDTDNSIEFIFDSSSDSRKDGAVLKGVYFRSNGKFMARVQPNGRFRASGPIWGVCQETSLSSSNSVPAPSPTSSSKLDKAKSTCADLGFTAGTEKHGECVLKLMDK